MIICVWAAGKYKHFLSTLSPLIFYSTWKVQSGITGEDIFFLWNPSSLISWFLTEYYSELRLNQSLFTFILLLLLSDYPENPHFNKSDHRPVSWMSALNDLVCFAWLISPGLDFLFLLGSLVSLVYFYPISYFWASLLSWLLQNLSSQLTVLPTLTMQPPTHHWPFSLVSRSKRASILELVKVMFMFQVIMSETV